MSEPITICGTERRFLIQRKDSNTNQKGSTVARATDTIAPYSSENLKMYRYQHNDVRQQQHGVLMTRVLFVNRKNSASDRLMLLGLETAPCGDVHAVVHNLEDGTVCLVKESLKSKYPTHECAFELPLPHDDSYYIEMYLHWVDHGAELHEPSGSCSFRVRTNAGVELKIGVQTIVDNNFPVTKIGVL